MISCVTSYSQHSPCQELSVPRSLLLTQPIKAPFPRLHLHGLQRLVTAGGIFWELNQGPYCLVE